MSLVEQLCMELRNLPDVRQSPSCFGSGRNLAWSVCGREFAHLHADDVIDLRLPRALQSGLRSDARARFRKSASEWLEFEFHSEADVADVTALAREAWAAARAAR